MKRSELIELARKHRVVVRPVAYSGRWVAYVGTEEIQGFVGLSEMVCWIANNNIKINN